MTRSVFDVRLVRNADDVAAMRAIRREVFVEEQNVPAELEWANDAESTHYLAWLENRAVACGRWRPARDGYKIERMAVQREFRGRGAGAAVLVALLVDLAVRPGEVYLNAQESAVPFYRRYGFVPVGPRFEEAGIPHFKMRLAS